MEHCSYASSTSSSKLIQYAVTSELSFKSGAKYPVGPAFVSGYTATEREQLRQRLVSPDIFVSASAAFSTKYLDIYDKYVLPTTKVPRCRQSVA